MSDWIVVENEFVTIGGFLLDGVTVAKHDFRNDVVTHPVEPGFEITNFIVNKPVEIRLSATLYSGPTDSRDTQLSYLKYLRDNKLPVEFFSTVTGYLESVVIEELDVETNNDSGNTYFATINLKEVQIVEIKAEVLHTIKDTDGTVHPNEEYDAGWSEDLETPKRQPTPIDYQSRYKAFKQFLPGYEEKLYDDEKRVGFAPIPERTAQVAHMRVKIHGEEVPVDIHMVWYPPKDPAIEEGEMYLKIESAGCDEYPAGYVFFQGYVWENVEEGKPGEYFGKDKDGKAAFLIYVHNHNFPDDDIRIVGTLK